MKQLSLPGIDEPLIDEYADPKRYEKVNSIEYYPTMDQEFTDYADKHGGWTHPDFLPKNNNKRKLNNGDQQL